MEKILMKGNEAIGAAAINAGCLYYYGYPITPQSELLEYMAVNLPKAGGVFLQSESELAGISMVYGTAATGKRVMTSSSSPGFSLMQEGLSYMASAGLPAVVVDISRGGPGLGRITPSQSDYFQATKGGGHGDYRLLVFAPASVQEMSSLTALAFELADKYRMPALILGDGIVAQMMEPVEIQETAVMNEAGEKDWAATGNANGKQHLVLSAPFTDPELITLNQNLSNKYRLIKEREPRIEEFMSDDAEILIVAYGIVSRFSKAAIRTLRAEKIKVGLIRPITLFPFPEKAIEKKSATAKAFLVVEMSEGQMIEDVRLAVNGKTPVYWFGGGGGKLTPPDMIIAKVKEIVNGSECK
ncbi:MAG: 3-methyl-2-oxobutanoate dehydrogenase subunit VorB [Acidaminococcales bacterium]|jgi:2-oxoglutarate ferredoxin oxidoreductase subunit alpha|nr:3-methyl-2-oxobutanoate dehydrogenase subunit VorB [Acidaminococcales bacterium]